MYNVRIERIKEGRYIVDGKINIFVRVSALLFVRCDALLFHTKNGFTAIIIYGVAK